MIEDGGGGWWLDWSLHHIMSHHNGQKGETNIEMAGHCFRQRIWIGVDRGQYWLVVAIIVSDRLCVVGRMVVVSGVDTKMKWKSITQVMKRSSYAHHKLHWKLSSWHFESAFCFTTIHHHHYCPWVCLPLIPNMPTRATQGVRSFCVVRCWRIVDGVLGVLAAMMPHYMSHD